MICKRDRAELVKAGLQLETILKLEELVSACSDADTVYQLRKENLRLATKEHHDFLMECKKLRSSLRENINRALKFTSHGSKIPSLYHKKLNSDLIQDLLNLATISRTNRTDFEKVNFDFSLSEKAATASEELSIAIAVLDLQRKSLKHEEIARRDRLYNELYDIIKEICTCGRYAFRDDLVHRRFYCCLK